MDWHKRITQARTAKNLKKTDLAKLVGVSPATVTMWESGQTKKIEGRNLVKVCEVLDISPIWLLGEIGRSEDAESIREEIQSVRDYSDHPFLIQLPIVQFLPDESEFGYRLDGEIELDMPSMFAVRRQWVWANRVDLAEVQVMRIKSMDMDPALHYGDIVAVRTSLGELMDGSIYVLIYEGAVLVRRLLRDAGEWWLTSDNPDQHRFARKLYRSTEVKVIGRVILRQTEKI
jgi:phage repressor protein C with HTH and peptisase S24 domain